MRLAGGNLLLSLVIFYSAVSIGFSSSVQYNSNLALFDACFNYLSQVKELNNYKGGSAFTPANGTRMDDLIIPLTGIQADSTDTPNQNQFLQDSVSADSLSADSLLSGGLADSAEVDSLARFRNVDSTARIKNFTHERKDRPYSVFGERKKRSGFYVYPSQGQTVIEIDSTGQYVLVKEVISDTETRIRLKIPFDEYIKIRLNANSRDAWEELAYKYEVKDGKKSLESLLTDITNIEIPLPSSSILSIFGPNRINLRIGGAVDIHGAWRNETTEGLTTSLTGNSRSEPDFKQQVQINVDGTIGDKLTIGADWNTERTFEYENQLKIKYTGYPDEIVQSVEAGNVSLQTSSLVGGSEALFGIKANFQMGPLTLTALASQKKGEIMEKSISSGAESQTFTKHAYDYSTNHYFLNEDYATGELFNKYYTDPNATFDGDQTVEEIEVWKSIAIASKNPKERDAIALLDMPPRFVTEQYFTNGTVPDTTVTKDIEVGRFILLTKNVDYELHEVTGYITLKTQVNSNEVIAVAYQKRKNAANVEDDEVYGEFVNDKLNNPNRRLLLKLVKPRDLKETDRAWPLQLKNIYPVGGKSINKEGFEFKILYKVEGAEEQPIYNNVQLLKAFGLDKYDESGNSSAEGDQVFDWRPNYTIMQSTGEIIFPTLQPFGANIIKELDSLKYPEIYSQLPSIAKQQKAKDKILLTGKYTGVSSGTFSIGFSAVENSVKVFLNGNQLKENVDYTVDYTIGQVVIRNDAALVAGADLKITYEQNDLFQLASKTLLGLRGVFDISNRTKLGFSALSLNQETLSDKVRIGEEPLSNSIYGVDFTTGADLPFLTKAIDKIISTNAVSSIDVRGEFAYMNPDPNTKKSPIAGDNGESIAYLDDFEGVKRIIPVGVYYSGWHDLSVPDSMPNFTLNTSPGSVKTNYKANAYWYNITPSNITVDDVWGIDPATGESRKKVGKNEQELTVLNFVYNPTDRGQYNYNLGYTPSTESWGGMMKVLSSSASNLVEENVEYIEFWANLWDVPQGAKIYIDIGKISEDVIPDENPKPNSEDKNGNVLIDQGEDVGMDGLPDASEPGYSVDNPDPANDNFSFTYGAGDYRRINRTEGNFQLTDAGGRIPDTEDLNLNGTTDFSNNYFRYEIPLDIDPADPFKHPYVVGGGYSRPNSPLSSPFYQFRIPLKDFKQKVGDPSLSFVEYLRIWVNGMTDTMRLRITEFNLVGNQWQKIYPKVAGVEDKNDSVMALSVVSIEDNSPIYYSPPGVERERDRSQTDEEVLRNEQSLELKINNLKDGQHREAVKYLNSSLDVFNYKEMKFFIHGDESATIDTNLAYYVSEFDYSSEVYFRFGADTNNYYEYRQPIKSGWNEVRVIFEKLTALKQKNDSIPREYVPEIPGAYFAVKGKPALTRISLFVIGIVNPKNFGTDKPVGGSLWINELRVLGADDTPGWAYTGSGTLKVADLMTVSANISRTDPYFHRLADRFGSRNDAKSWGANLDIDVLKLLPFKMKESNLRLNYARSESVSDPLYVPGTDIKVDQAAREIEAQMLRDGASAAEASAAAKRYKIEAQSVNVSNTFTLSQIKLRLPSDYWLIRDSFNSLIFSFSYNNTKGRNPSVVKTESWTWSASVTHSVTLSNDYFFYPADIPVLGSFIEIFSDYRNVKLFYTPQTINSGIQANRRYGFSLLRQTSNTTSTKPSVTRDFTASRNASFSWKLTDGGFLNPSLTYSASANSSLLFLLTENDIERSESDIWKDIFTGTLFGKDYQYSQSVDIKTNPKLPSLWNISRYITLNGGYRVNYSWSNNFVQDVLGRSAMYQNNISTGLTIKLKSLFEPLFKDINTTSAGKTTGATSGRGARNTGNAGNRTTAAVSDTTKPVAISDSTASKGMSLQKVYLLFKAAFHWTLIDYESISINFSQDNSMSGGALYGKGNGFSNFWNVFYDAKSGPTRSFMLGLSNDLGRRAPNGNLTDSYSQNNKIDLSTSRPLWEGAQIKLKWNLGWSFNKSTTMRTDDYGNPTISTISSTGTLSRSFFTVPPVFIFSMFNSGMKKVFELYDPDSENPNEALTDAFINGFESFPLLAKSGILSDLSKFIPRPNWDLTWDGLEKFSLFESFAKKVSLNHSYTSSISEGWQIKTDGRKNIQSEKINYGFAPLLGLNMTFNSFWGGNMTGSLRYSTKSAYDLGLTTNPKTITESYSNDIGITASYSKSGFEWPLFGLSLKNDIEVSLSYTSGRTSSIQYDMEEENENGEPLDGTIRTSLEPRLKYVVSSKVTLSVFYKRTTVEPEGASRITPTTTNEMGLDIHISIQ